MNKIQKTLLKEALTAAKLSYAPYSHFRVGAAIYSNGKVYCGANIENASSNLGICAERVAIANARMQGASHIDGIAIFCVDAQKDSSDSIIESQTLPCGACLQWLSELAPNAWIVTNGSEKIYHLTDLMPKPFKL